MPDSIAALADAIVGHRIVKAEPGKIAMNDFSVNPDCYGDTEDADLILTLDDGRRVAMIEHGDRCAFTEIKRFLLHHDRVDHAITGVRTEDGYTKWHILADFGDVLELDVAWSCGNPFYYSYGFTIMVSNTIEGSLAQREIESGDAT